MWNRFKRLINSNLDNMISKVENPTNEIAQAGQAKTAQLARNEVDALAMIKLFEKEKSELETKIPLIEKRLETLTNDTQRMILQSQLDTMKAELIDKQQRILQMKGQLAQIRRARETHPGQLKETLNNAALASMGETLASHSMPTSANDPAWVMDEMRTKIERNTIMTHDAELAAKVAEADEELAKPKVDDLLEQYKREVASGVPDSRPSVTSTAAPAVVETKTPEPSKTESAKDPAGGKSLGAASEIKSLD